MKKKILGLIYVALTLVITVIIVGLSTDYKELWRELKEANWWWLLGSVACMIFYTIFESFPVYLAYKHHGEKLRFRDSVKVGLIGLYYSGITPSSSGGQPMQVYYFSKLNMPVGLSSYLSALKTIVFQAIMTGFCILGAIIEWPYLCNINTFCKPLLALGVGINVILLGGMLLLLKKPKVLNAIVNFFVKIISKIIPKKAEAVREKVENTIKNFYDSYSYSKKQTNDRMTVFICTLFQIMSYLAVPFFIYKAFGFTGSSFIQIFLVQAMVVCSVSFIPTPGAAGAQEAGFPGFFAEVFHASTGPAMLIWRVLSSYLVIVAGALCVTVDTLKGFTKKPHSIENKN